jgi:type IV pilus assembly protein PilC
VMIDAGLPLVQALDILGTQADNVAFKKVLLAVKGKVEAGSTFADALQDHPKVFDELFVQLVRAGEIGGILDTILQRLGAYIEKNEKLARRVKGAMVYPAIVLSVAVGVVGVLIAFVVPTFEKMFKDFGGALPGPTQFLVDVSHGFRETWYLYLGIPTVLWVAFKFVTKKGRGQEIWSSRCRCSARSRGRSRWPASRARSAPCSPPACRSSTPSRSSPSPPATR